MRTIYRSDRHDLFYIISPCAKMTSDIGLMFTLQREQFLYVLQYLNITYSPVCLFKSFFLRQASCSLSFPLPHLFSSKRLLQVERPAVKIEHHRSSLKKKTRYLSVHSAPQVHRPSIKMERGLWSFSFHPFGLLEESCTLNGASRSCFSEQTFYSACVFPCRRALECHIFLSRPFSTCPPLWNRLTSSTEGVKPGGLSRLWTAC